MKKWTALAIALALLAIVLLPGASFTADADTVLLAQAIYALARDDTYDAKLAIGSVAMNRIDSVWFSDTLGGVLTEQHQFPAGRRYDSESLDAARAVLSGRRVLGRDALYYQSLRASHPRADLPIAIVGGFAFYNN